MPFNPLVPARRLAPLAGALALAIGPVAVLAPAAAQATITGQGACFGDPTHVKLHVVVQGVRSNQGVMTATVYGDDPHKFLHGGGDVLVWRVDASTPTTEMCAYLPKAGSYAVVVYHDAKRAYRFTRGTFGPTQDYGFSRNPYIFLGPPSLNSTKFPAADGDTTIYVKLKYP